MIRLFAWFTASLGALLCLYPFLWMFLSSFKTNREIYEPTLLFPQSYEWGAFASLLNGEYLSFFQSFGNSWSCLVGRLF